VAERLLYGETLLRVEGERLLEEVDGRGAGVRVKLGEGPLLAEGEGTRVAKEELVSLSLHRRGGEGSPDVIPRSSRVDGIELVERRRAKNVEDKGELVVVVAAGEDRLAREHLGKDASDGPDVDGLGCNPSLGFYPEKTREAGNLPWCTA
jgi:hypothetical protein